MISCISHSLDGGTTFLLTVGSSVANRISSVSSFHPTVRAEFGRQYLDFLFTELRRLRLRALLDAQMQAEEIAAIVSRYRDAIHGVEIENEVLIFGINDGREKYWNAIYDAVKKVDPNIPVHLTGHTNAGAFERLGRLGVKSDRIGWSKGAKQ